MGSHGKTLRRSYVQATGKKALHLVSAWAAEHRLVLAQMATEEKSNEITAIPRVLRQLALAGCIVTIDEMGMQTAIAVQIIDQEGDYMLALKKNQGTLYQGVKETFTLAQAEQFAHVQHQFHQTMNKGHGRLEIRRHWTISDQENTSPISIPRGGGKVAKALGWCRPNGAWASRSPRKRGTTCSVS